MREGLTALVSLSGAPLTAGDLLALELEADDRLVAPGFVGRVTESNAAAVSRETGADGLALLLGYLDEPEELAGVLGMSADSSPVALALEALARFGADAAGRMLGQWTLLRWDGRARELTLLASEALRDVVYFAVCGDFLAISPSCLALGRLPWVGQALDLRGLALLRSRAGLRHIWTDETIWRGVRLLSPGTLERFCAGRRETKAMGALDPPERWDGSFAELVEALDELGRRVVRQQMTRYGRCAFHLSGGLDSTLMTAWGSLERGAGREMFAITSAAPPGSGLVDELEFSVPAAAALGVDLRPVWPTGTADLYDPGADSFRQNEGPGGGSFPVLEALDAAALAGGATAVVGGWAGEMHVSNGQVGRDTRSAARRWGARIRDRLVHRRAQGGWPARAFGVQFSQKALAELPAEWAGVWRKGPPQPPPAPGPRDPIGISPMAAKAARTGTLSAAGGLRILAPFYDRRLVRLGARIPVEFLAQDGLTRPIARALLRGRVPDAVRLRTQARPFSPDFVPGLRLQATAARARMGAFRDAGVGEVLDLPWLEEGLSRLGASAGPADYGLCYQVQSTAVLAEFLLWARGEGIGWF